jgi:hypothetical protein
MSAFQAEAEIARSTGTWRLDPKPVRATTGFARQFRLPSDPANAEVGAHDHQA